MKLELFDFIDETLKLIEERKESIEIVADSLEKFFKDSFFIKDHFVNVNYRIKSAESLREKILRYNFYLKYETPENLLKNLSDLIGFRIECRFIEDEEKIYNDIIKLFNIKCNDGFYTNPINSNIMLHLDEKQPQIQKNGFEIYKIDGKYENGDVCLNFELQIKSLVNIFWGEIDHKVLYKNFSYMLREEFFRDIMSSIKDNLSMIDRQLMLVYDHLNELDASNTINKKTQLKAMLSKIIHDIYIVKIRQEIGFIMDFKKSTDVIVNYLFMKGGPEESDNYSSNFLRILNRLNEIGKNDVPFNRYISFERDIFFNDEFTRKVGNGILEILNKDFRWNLFFRIIFEIEEGSNAEDFEGFMIFIRFRFYNNIKDSLVSKNIDEKEIDEIIFFIMDSIASRFVKDTDVDFLSDSSIETLNAKLSKELDTIDDFQSCSYIKDKIIDIVNNHKY